MRDARSGPRWQGASHDAHWHATFHANSRATRPLPLGNRAVEQPLDREDHPHLVLFHPHLAPSRGVRGCVRSVHSTYLIYESIHDAHLHNTGIFIHDAYLHAYIYKVLPGACFIHLQTEPAGTN